MRRLLIGLLLFPIFSFADHEPPEYSFAAKRGNLPTRNLAIFAPSSDPRPISQSSYQDQFISTKLDDLLLGEPKVGLAALAISKGQLVYQRYLRDVEDNLYPSWSMAKSIVSLTVGYALCDGKIASLNDKAELYAYEQFS